MKPLFKGKTSGVSDEVLLEKDKILPDDTEELHWYLKKELHWYFNSIVSSLGITENKFVIEKMELLARQLKNLLWNFNSILVSYLLKVK